MFRYYRNGHNIKPRHRASTSMYYSLTFCVRFLLPERHQWKPAVQTAAVVFRTPRRRRAGRARFPYAARGFWGAPRRRPAASADPAQPAVRTMSSYRGMDASLELEFALCCHSNATRAPIANPPNSAQLGGIPYHSPNLHPGPCDSVGMRPRTDRQTHRRA